MGKIKKSAALTLIILTAFFAPAQLPAASAQLTAHESGGLSFAVNETNLSASGQRINLEDIPAPAAIASQTAALLLETAAPLASSTVGKIIKIILSVEPFGAPVNLVNSYISYSTSTLKLLAIDYDSSPFSIFMTGVDSPGRITATAFNPSPGISKRSEVAALFFRVLDPGEVELKIMRGSSVMANDGFGTDVLGQTAGLRFPVN